MFSRLKGAIDSRIAEEQARQRQAQIAAQKQSPARRRPQNSNATGQRPLSRVRDGPSTPGEKQPDPADFVIGEDEGTSTPAIEKTDPLEKSEEGVQQKDEEASEKQPERVEATEDNAEVKPADANDGAKPVAQPVELPIEVRSKLRRLEKLEAKYGELLKAYRAAHQRVQTIEPFEASLRENTPLTSISDPSTLVEYLSQVKLKGDMVLEELKRVSAERDDFKRKSEQSEQDAAALKAEVEELKLLTEKKSESTDRDAEEGQTTQDDTGVVALEGNEKQPSGTETTAKSPPSARLGSLSLFSPKFGAAKEATKDTVEDLFSYDSEVPRLEQELQERCAQVEDLAKQVSTLQGDLSVARESTSNMVQTLENATYELNTLREEKEKFETARAGLASRITQLEADASSGSSRVDDLHNQIKALQVQNDEAATEIEKLKEQIEDVTKAKSELEIKLEAETKNKEEFNKILTQKNQIVKDLEKSLAVAKVAEDENAQKTESVTSSEKKLSTIQGVMENLRKQLNTAENTVTELKKEVQSKEDEFNNKPSSKVFGFLDKQKDPKLSTLTNQKDVVDYLSEHYGLQKKVASQTPAPTTSSPTTAIVPSENTNNVASGKKKNKKKKKGAKGQSNNVEDIEPDVPVKVSEDLNDIGDDTPPAMTSASSTSIAILEKEVSELHKEIEAKTAAIDRLSQRIKDQEALQEEIETLRDDLLHQGQEHVEARDALKEAQGARKALQENVEKLEGELTVTRKQMTTLADSEKAYNELTMKFDELKTKSDMLQKDLTAAESLATARFKDISDLKEVLSKAQPELRQLRSEVAELKSAKDDLRNREGDLKRLENRHEDLKSEMKGLSKRLGDKDSEIKELQTKIEQETKARNKVENDLSSAQLDARVAENKRKDTSEILEQRQKDLTRAKDEAANLRKKVAGLEETVSSHSKDISSLKEEVTLKTALHSSSQSLVQSLRDQAHELSMQARESSSRAESLEEELAESQRMLTERTRESQTMRSLLDQAQNGVEARIREMKERMEAAIEERDRVEDEANVRDRRLMREVEDARTKMRDAQKQLKGLEDERDDLDTRSRDWKRRRDDLEQQARDAKKDVEDVRQAMKGLRDALDESERQLREVETQKAELRKQTDETNERVDKLTKANKNLSEEIKKLQETGVRRGNVKPAGGNNDGGPRSSRASMESTRSPGPPLRRDESTSTLRSETPTGARNSSSNVGLSQGTVDYVYLKNVLLQFMERKDKSHQRQLVPVLGMLLHFDQKDEQKWMAAISSK